MSGERKARKLLVLGGKPIGSSEIVEYARSQGAHAIVADYLPVEESPAKQVADEAWDVSTADVDELERRCREAGVDGVAAGVHEFNIERAIELSSRLGLPFWCTSEQWRAIEDKESFKGLCRSFGIAVAREYAPEEAASLPDGAFPLAVKPRDGSGSRGFSKCARRGDLPSSIARAQAASPGGDVLVEEYIDSDAVIVQYTAHLGEIVYSGMLDKASRKMGESGAPIMAVQVGPSIHEEEYLRDVDSRAKAMLASIGLREGPVWIEAFCKDGRFVFNEAGLRFGGSLTDRFVERMAGIDQLDLLFACVMGEDRHPLKARFEKSRLYMIWPVHLKPGRIAEVRGIDALRADPRTAAVTLVHGVGDEIEEWGSAQQVFAYIHLCAPDAAGLLDAARDAARTLDVLDAEGRRMLTWLFDPFADEASFPAFLKKRLSESVLRPTRYLTDADLVRAWRFDVVGMLDVVERSFLSWREGKVILPDKSSQIIDGGWQNRVNCMPATLLDEGVSGAKLVSVFPENAGKGIPNVSGAIVLLSARTGERLAVMDAGFVTALRTALVGALGAKRLSKPEPKTLGILGSGEQARMHALVLCGLFPSIKECRVASRNPAHSASAVSELSRLMDGVDLADCGDAFKRSASGADIVVTAISGQEEVLRAAWLSPGALYIHVGGLEDEYDVALKADKIVCDSWEAVKHRAQTISRMYKDGILSDGDIHADIAEVISGEKPGREGETEIIYFDSVGMAFTDIAIAYELLERCKPLGLGVSVEEKGSSLHGMMAEAKRELVGDAGEMGAL